MAGRDRSAFEMLWIAKGAPPSSTQAIESFAQERKREVRAEKGFRQAGFVSADAPFAAKTLFNQQQDVQRFAEIATAEGSTIEPGSWPDLVDVTLSRGENVDMLLDAGGRLPAAERQADRLTGAAADEAVARQAYDHILDHCETIDDAGVDGADVLEALLRDEHPLDVPGVDLEQVNADLEEIADEFGRRLVVDAIAECRDRLAGPAAGMERGTQDILDELRERFGVTGPSMERALDQLEERVEQAESEAREAAVNRLSRAFGEQFDSLDTAIERLRERIAAARGERLRFADIRVRRATGETRIFIDSENSVFDECRDNVKRRVRRELDLTAITPPRTVTVGEITVRGETLEEINLAQGREQVGATTAPQPTEAERAAQEQAELPAAETDIEQLADRAISLLAR